MFHIERRKKSSEEKVYKKHRVMSDHLAINNKILLFPQMSFNSFEAGMAHLIK